MDDNTKTTGLSELECQIAARIKQCRIKDCFTQREMAAYLDVSTAAYTNYENAKRSFPHDILLKVSSILNITMNYIYTGEKMDNPFEYKADSIDFDIEYNKWIATQNFLESLGHEIEFFSATHPEDAMIIIDCVEFTPSKFKKLISSLNDLINTAQYFVENSEDYESVLKPDFDFAEDDYENKSGNLYGKDNI